MKFMFGNMQCILDNKYIVANAELRYNTVESDVYVTKEKNLSGGKTGL